MFVLFNTCVYELGRQPPPRPACFRATASAAARMCARASPRGSLAAAGITVPRPGPRDVTIGERLLTRAKDFFRAAAIRSRRAFAESAAIMTGVSQGVVRRHSTKSGVPKSCA